MARVVCVIALMVASCGRREPITLHADGAEAHFDDAAHLTISDHEVSIALWSIGRDGAMREAGGASVRHGDRVELTRDSLPGVIEWWTTAGRGLEHGVTIADRPIGEGALRLVLAVDGVEPSGEESIRLGEIATYAGLSVIDATGVSVPAHMRAIDHTIAIIVDDAHATYPLVVDPYVFTLEATLTATSTVSDAAAGTSVAITPDGSCIIVGEPSASMGSGRATVYHRSGTSWTVEGTLSDATLPNSVQFGRDVSISADCNTAAVGVPFDNAGTGSVRIFQRNALLAWHPSATITSTNSSARSVGTLARISPDGLHVAVAEPGALLANIFEVFAYNTITGQWTLETSGVQANSLAWSGDSLRLAIGSTSFNSGMGRVVVFSHAPNWTQEIVLNGMTPNEALGGSVSFDATGSWLVAAGLCQGTCGGSPVPPTSRFYQRNVNTWFLRSTFGAYVGAIAGDASVAYGLPVSGVGGGFSYTRSGTVWNGDTLYSGVLSTMNLSAIATTTTGSRIVLGEASSGSGQTQVVHAQLPTGDPCDVGANADCISGFCVDGMCCDSACGGGHAVAGNCSACAAMFSNGPDGTCSPLNATLAPNTECRASVGPCDVAEHCIATAPSCPTDAFMPATATCRASAGMCDVPETCSGSSASCPADAFVTSGVRCRAPSGPCDAPNCTGATADCPTLLVQPTTTVCATSAGPCEMDTHCDGTFTACPARNFVAAGTVCHTMAGACDSTTMCTGSSAACPDPLLRGNVCRMAAGACDVAETCSGANPNCPADTIEGAGTVCRASTASCDPAESCDGTSTMCPADVTTCPAMPDSGVHDAGPSNDAGARDASGSDAITTGGDAATTPPPVAGGCGCRTTHGSNGGWLALLALAIVARRRAMMRA
jgi:MYXO-CTERM domain-containing protein